MMLFFFFNDTATTEIYTLSLHDALPISCRNARRSSRPRAGSGGVHPRGTARRSEEHTSELQSQSNLVCRLLLEKKKKITIMIEANKKQPTIYVYTATFYSFLLFICVALH